MFLPRLRVLQLCGNKLNAAAAKQLAKGSWPELDCLSLNDNYLDDAAMLHLSQGHWPALSWLCLQENNITAVGVNFLTNGDWDRLTDLYLDTRAVSADTWQALSLDAACMPDLTKLKWSDTIIATRLDVLSDPIIWPNLTEVTFDFRMNFDRKMVAAKSRTGTEVLACDVMCL